jgi:NAD(P)-dependent dehydrogenase (short-subunit alcohol dehydrogenase family)
MGAGRLADRVAIVTGAARGIGRAYALRLAAEGAHVVAADRLPSEETAAEIRGLGRECLALAVDVSDGGAVQRMAAETVKRFGRIDVLVNNAAMMAELRQSTPFDAIDEAEWDRVMAVNVKGPWLCARAVVPVMRRQGRGRIVNVSSIVFFLGTPFLLHYCVSKGAVVAFTRSLSTELGGTGITVNAVAPGLTMTPAMVETAGDRLQELCDYYVAGQAVKRPEEPRDLVGAVAFLASDDAEFVSGQTLVVDGGFYKQ